MEENMNKEQLRQGLEVMRTDELIDIIIEQDRKIMIYEEQERKNTKQGKWDNDE